MNRLPILGDLLRPIRLESVVDLLTRSAPLAALRRCGLAHDASLLARAAPANPGSLFPGDGFAPNAAARKLATHRSAVHGRGLPQ